MKAIPVEFILKQCDALTSTAAMLPAGEFRDALVLRATHLMDLVRGWQAHSSGTADNEGAQRNGD